MNKPQEPFSTVTALIYPLTGYLGYEITRSPEGAVFALGMLALGLATGWRHWAPSDRSSKADQMSMHVVFAGIVVLALGAPWYWMLIAGAGAAYALEDRYHLPLRPIMGIYGALTLIAVSTQSGYDHALAVALPIGVALYIRDQGGDVRHGWWHLATGAAILVAFVGVA